jgi:hypothetical protein
MEQGKKQRRASLVLEDKIIETIYDKKTEQTQFAVYANSKVEFLDSITKDGEKIFPLDGKSDIVSKSVVLLPSQPIEYGTEAELIAEIQKFIHKYLDISPIFEVIASYYVLFSWLYDKFHEVPYLRAIGDFGCGKSRFLQTVGSICYKPIFTGGATTTAPIFRILNEIHGTLILDEADLRFSDMTSDIIKILNMGYQKGSPVLRMGGKEMQDLKAFDVFSPKIIATRETFSDKALESRFLTEEMGRSKLREDISRRLSKEFYDEALGIRNKLLLWRFRTHGKELSFDEALIQDVHPRLHQIVIPLMTIIESVEVKKSFKEFVQKYNEELIADRGLSRESEIILAILKFEHDTNKKQVGVGEIAGYMNQDSLDPKDRITARKVGWYLRAKMQLKPYRTARGWVLDIGRSRDKLDFWKERYGITDKDLTDDGVHEMYDVHIAEEEESVIPTAAELGFRDRNTF